jgi:hypothetical protein
LRKIGIFPDFNLGTQRYNVGIYLLLQDTSSDFILFWKIFTTRANKKKALAAKYKGFFFKNKWSAVTTL